MDFDLQLLTKIFDLPHRKMTSMETYLEENQVESKKQFFYLVLLGNGYNENFDGYIAFMKKFSTVQLDFANLYEHWAANKGWPIFSTEGDGSVEQYSLLGRNDAIERYWFICTTIDRSKGFLRQRSLFEQVIHPKWAQLYDDSHKLDAWPVFEMNKPTVDFVSQQDKQTIVKIVSIENYSIISSSSFSSSSSS